jgi:glycerol uptake facilitator-like aquaporin
MTRDYTVILPVILTVVLAGTAVAIIYSPWGKQSGAHFNPAVTLVCAFA